MQDFDPHKFAAGSFLIGAGVTAGLAVAVLASARSTASLIDEQRRIDRAIIQSQIARAKARAARREAEAALASLDASASLRLAAASARKLKI